MITTTFSDKTGPEILEELQTRMEKNFHYYTRHYEGFLCRCVPYKYRNDQGFKRTGELLKQRFTELVPERYRKTICSTSTLNFVAKYGSMMLFSPSNGKMRVIPLLWMTYRGRPVDFQDEDLIEIIQKSNYHKIMEVETSNILSGMSAFLMAQSFITDHENSNRDFIPVQLYNLRGDMVLGNRSGLHLDMRTILEMDEHSGYKYEDPLTLQQRNKWVRNVNRDIPKMLELIEHGEDFKALMLSNRLEPDVKEVLFYFLSNHRFLFGNTTKEKPPVLLRDMYIHAIMMASRYYHSTPFVYATQHIFSKKITKRIQYRFSIDTLLESYLYFSLKHKEDVDKIPRHSGAFHPNYIFCSPRFAFAKCTAKTAEEAYKTIHEIMDDPNKPYPQLNIDLRSTCLN